MTEDRATRLDRLGLAVEDLAALERLFERHVDALLILLNERALTLAAWSYSALDSVDAIAHKVNADVAHLFLGHGFTPHQAFVFANNTRAQENLWTEDENVGLAHEILETDLPRTLLLRILLVAKTHEEVGVLLDACTGAAVGPGTAYADAASAIESVNLLAGFLPHQLDTCDCGRLLDYPYTP